MRKKRINMRSTFFLEAEPAPVALKAMRPTPTLPFDEQLFAARVGVCLRAIRLLKHVRQSELASGAGLDVGTIGRMERGETVGTILSVAACERALQLKPGLLMRLASIDR